MISSKKGALVFAFAIIIIIALGLAAFYFFRSGVKVVDMGEEFTLKIGNTVELPDGKFKMSVDEINSDLSGGRPAAAITYNLMDENGQYKNEKALMETLHRSGDYRIMLIESDGESRAKMKIDERFRIEDCERLSPSPELKHCYQDVAEAGRDISVCENSDSGQASYCRIAFAITHEDVGLCDQLEDQKMSTKCYTEMAVRKKDKAICEKIQDTDHRSNCEYRIDLSSL